ncbi:MAG TPA: alpha/beta fold hydrolase, partial [Mycobacterium sp.]|nr:alpha/beta fold hydrolase [Mycobacterium sp.]
MTDYNVFDIREPGRSSWPWRPAHRWRRGGVTPHRYTQDEAARGLTEFADPGSCDEQPHPFRSAMMRDRTRILGRGVTRTVKTSDGVSLSVREYGSRDPAHTVVLLHGLCLTKDSWTIPIDHLLHQYGDGIRIISYDHRGHGDSAAAPMHTYHIDRLAADLADLLTALGVTGPLTLAGHSMGGMVALAYLGRPAGQRPVQPHGLILVATAAGKLTERGLGRFLANPATDILYELAQHAPRAAEHAFRALARPVCGVLVRFGGY